MLKTRDLHDVPTLFELLSHPEVYPYVRQKAATSDEYYFMTKQSMAAEAKGELISRTILDKYEQPIGTINLFDMNENYGFLATWIGQPYFGMGYNKVAKEEFFNELFFELNIEAVFLKVRRTNTRSLKAVMKLSFVAIANELYQGIFDQINQEENIYDLFVITKEHYLAYLQFSDDQTEGDVEVS